MELRRCVACKIEKPATNEYFHKDKNRYLGLMYRCKDCDSKRIDNRSWKDRYAAMSPEAKEKQRQAKKDYLKTPIGRAICSAAAYRKADEKRGMISEITKKDILHVKTINCDYCGFPATGFDRRDNSKGHTKDNCIPCCLECNVARMDNFSHEEMKIIWKAIRKVKMIRAKNT